jgi:hypothetical protein
MAERTPVTIEGYSLGDEGNLHHFNALASRDDAAAAAKDLEVGDAAFIKRSDLKWTYAILVEKATDEDGVVFRFEVDADKNRKSFPQKQWGKYIRVIEETAEEKAAPAAEDDSTKVSTLSDSVEVVEKPEEVPAAEPAKGWFSGFFGAGAASQQSHPTVSTNNSLKESVEVPVEQFEKVPTSPVAAEPAVEEEPAVAAEPVAEEEPVVEEDKENDVPAPPADITPTKKSRSFLSKIPFSRSSSQKKSPSPPTPKKTVEEVKEQSLKEWFDPLASEVDYDKNPTDLFQALEARQFEYAVMMATQQTKQFKKDCSTWVVAKSKKRGASLRFRALPLHAAVVFGAPDDLTKAILEAYPLATKGRDVKGRLPVHLACEHEVSDDVLIALINAFPKAFYAKDKTGKTPIDYMNDNGDRKWIKQMIPPLLTAKIENERTKWDEEKADYLIEYREKLKEDPEYIKDLQAAVEKASEKKYANQFELMELAHKKEIEMLKMKHANETQALLEGFEVKLNFERKLQSLKSTKQ